MSELEQEVPVRDAMDGGFAVVDRERLIEEETRVRTPWYKHFINSMIAPTKMMEENFEHEPVRGMSVAVVGILVFTILTLFLQHANPSIRQLAYDMLRTGGVEEDMIHQQYMVKLVVSGLVSVIGIFFSVFILTIILQILKAIAKDKCKFASLFTMMLVCYNVYLGVQVIDNLAANMLGVSRTVLNVGSFFSAEALAASSKLSSITLGLSLGEALRFIYMIIGYKILTHVSTKKAIMVCSIFELITIGCMILFAR